ncbi:MAG: amino acid ABC transporter permease [Clostridia bacterium]|nr:amino acid ABC transporter permease [Clostridia bacterium]
MQYLLEVIKAVADGSKVTLGLFAITLVFSIPLGLIIALAQVLKFKALRSAAHFYIWLMRGTPLLLQVYFVFFGFNFLLNELGIDNIERFPAACIAFGLNYAAYFAEIFRAGIQSIDKGQYEAADVLGMTYPQTMRRIILPQMIRRVLPPVSNEVITLVKDTALVYAIGLSELLKAAKDMVVRDFSVIPFGVAAAFYLIMTLLLTWAFKRLEKRYSVYE